VKAHKVFFALTLLVAGMFLGIALVIRTNMDNSVAALDEKANSPVISDSNVTSLENAFVKVAEKVSPAVVSIVSERTETVGGILFSPFEGDEFFDKFFRDFFGEVPKRKFRSMGLGSGIIVDPKGYILTNEHVIHNADKITVTLPDGREFRAKLIGKDYRSDIAVLKIKAENLPYVVLGDSDKVKIGQWAIAIGNPFGFAVHSPKPTVTVGVISALHRQLPATEYRERIYTDLIQTDAAINPGNSGGPLVNLRGEVIGINVAIYTTSGGYQGIGFAIPSNQAKYIMAKLIKGEEVSYGWLGVKVQDLNQELAEYFGLPDQKGALVAKVLKGGPAEKAGMKEGDVIRKFNGQEVENTADLVNKVAHTEAGKTVEIEIIRDKKPLTLKVKIGKRPLTLTEETAGGEYSWRGITVSDLTLDVRKKFGIEEEGKGVVVIAVEEESPAWNAGIKVGDIIEEINHHLISNVDDFEKVTQQIKGKALVRTQRGYFLIPPEE
jgi:serine protease Do